jgi:eukaryotic-like serine/threonine-protein kinase
MPLSVGSHLGSYEVLSAIGAGGMGDVYRARDTKLHRDVALKILPDAFATDPERLTRFEREAKTLAALNHPHIAQIHGFEQANGVSALVMEFVEGEDLAQRLAHGAMPVDETLPIARQIAEALEAAHEQGIIHRDLKPANIKLRPDGTVKVLDFGLAKVLDSQTASAAPGNPSISPTLTAATQLGVILGTAAYMSPEQARGRAVDKRADVWSFGCVLYEMLTGKRAFDGEDVTETIAAVVRADPDWSALPSTVPDQIRLLLRRCLEKDPRARVSDVAVAQFLMTETLTAAPAPRQRGVTLAVLAATTVAAAVAAALATRALTQPPARPPARVVRFTLTPPAMDPLQLLRFAHDIAITPDGSAIVYRAGTSQGVNLFVQPLNSLTPRKIEIPGARDPFLSPDGRWIGYFTPNELRKVPITGGPSFLVYADPRGASARGASWGPDDRIVFARFDQQPDGLMSVAASGGDAKVLTRRDAARGDGDHALPFVLPNGRGVLYAITPVTPGSPQNRQIAVLDFRSGQSKILVHGGSAASYIGSGHLVYAAGRALLAAPFDLERLQVTGDAEAIVDDLATGVTGNVNYAVSRDGTLVYAPASSMPNVLNRRLVWVGRDGREEPIVDAPIRGYAVARISPDGTRVALDIREARGGDIWIWDLARKTLSPMSLDPSADLSPLWTPNGRRVLWASSRAGGNPNIFWQSAEGTGPVDRLSTSRPAQFPISMTPDGSRVVIFRGNAGEESLATELAVLRIDPVDAKQPGDPLPLPPGVNLGGEVSPNGRWLAYQSNESGQRQIYVRPFPNVQESRTQISTKGGTRPVWARDGRELFYLNEDDLLTSVSIQTTASCIQAGVPNVILSTRYYAGSSTRGYDLRSYDVTVDGQRFLMIKEMSPESTPALASMVVVVNWAEEAKSRMGAK